MSEFKTRLHSVPSGGFSFIIAGLALRHKFRRPA